MKLSQAAILYLFISFTLAGQQDPLQEWINQVYKADEFQTFLSEVRNIRNQYKTESHLIDSINNVLQEDGLIDSTEKYQAIYVIDSLYIPQGHYDKAIGLASVIKNTETHSELDLYYHVYSYNLLANLFKLNNDFESADYHWKSLIEYLENQKPIPNLLLARVYFDYQFLYVNTNTNRSLELLEEAESSLLKSTSGNSHLERKIYTEILKRYNTLGYYDKAEKYLNKIWNPYLERGRYQFSDIHMEGDFLYENMYYYYITRNYQKADHIYKLTEAFVKKHRFKPQFPQVLIAGVYTSYGDLYTEKDLDISISSYRMAMEINDNQDDPGYWLQYLFNFSKAYLYKGDPDMAEIIANEVIEKAEPIEDVRLPFFYALLGNISLVKGELEEAIANFNAMINLIHQGKESIQILTMNQDFQPGNLMNEVFMLKTMADRVLENFHEDERASLLAYNLYYAALMHFSHNLRKQNPNDFLKGMAHGIIQGVFNTHPDHTDDPMPRGLIIEFSENFHSGFLWQKFHTNYNESLLVDTVLINKAKILTDEITQLKKKSLTDDDNSLKATVFDKELELDELERNISRLYPSYAHFSTFNFNLKNFINNNPDDQLILKYNVFGDNLYVFRIWGDNIDHNNLGNYSSILELASSFYEMISTPWSDLDSINILAEELGKVLLPMELNNVKNLVIIPDKYLYFLPFEVLKKGDYLLNTQEISYAVSLSLMTSSSQPPEIRKSALFAPSYSELAPPVQLIAMRGEQYDLDGAKKEVAKIHDIIPSTIFTEERASKETFMQVAEEYDLLHLSMHSTINNEDPSLSALVFSDSEGESEFYLNQLYAFNLNADMVVLSACNTGVGPEKSGEGIVSMKRAFKYAGAPSIVSSLWSAPDQATQEIITEFYQKLSEGSTKSTAMRQAKISFLNTHASSRLVHPFYWAGFIVDGDITLLRFSSSNDYRLWLLLFMGALLLIPVIRKLV